MVDVIIEIPKNSRIKYEKDEKYNKIRCDRYLKTPFVYPFNYGYIPNTLGPDNDPLDVFVLTPDALFPNCIIKCKVIGGISMIDNGEQDDKIIAIPSPELNFPNLYFNNNEINKDVINDIRFFLNNYKFYENKKVELGKFLSIEEVEELIKKYSK